MMASFFAYTSAWGSGFWAFQVNTYIFFPTWIQSEIHNRNNNIWEASLRIG